MTAATSENPDASLPAGLLPTGLGATDVLTADDVRDRLTGTSLEALTGHLDITGQDREELLPLAPRVLDDPELLAEVTRTVELLRAAAGLDVPDAPLSALAPRHRGLQERIVPGEGLIAILSLLASTDTVRAWHAARGYADAFSWEALADLGQQMRVHRAGSGRLGLHQVPWMAMIWRGRLVRCGRLQFDLHRAADDGRWILGAHIPARGSLEPDAVEESFVAATEFFPRAFPDLLRGRPAGAAAFGREFECHSWLMNRLLVDELGTESNIGAFVDRWEIVDSAPGADGAAFFVFDARPPYDAASLPRRTRLERLVGERLADGRGWETGHGILRR